MPLFMPIEGHGITYDAAKIMVAGFHSMSEKALCEVNMTYSTMRSYFRTAERAHQHLSGFIVFSSASFDKEDSVESRTYAVSSDNKAFRSNMEAVRSMVQRWTVQIPMCDSNGISQRNTVARMAGESSGAI
ncbi:MAG: hypothetical protein V8S86_08620 [Eubacteriales bacterium]